jgi:amino-acid N-acetyltransferase
MIRIRRATITDIPALSQVINDCAEQGIMLHRSLSYLYERVRDFFIITADQDDGSDIVGVCGLKVIWADLAEVYALAVKPETRGHGYGRQLVQACIDESRQLGVRRLMALTYEKTFFTKLGFEEIDRQQLPLKVWSECIGCAKSQACDEIAVVFTHADIPVIQSPRPQVPPNGSYEVPVILNNRLSKVGPRLKMDEAR